MPPIQRDAHRVRRRAVHGTHTAEPADEQSISVGERGGVAERISTTTGY